VGEVNALNEISDRQDAFRVRVGHCRRSYDLPRFVFDVARGTFAASSDRTNLLGYPVMPQLAVSYSIFKVSNVPVTACLEDISSLLPFSSHLLLSFP
jgi:hypothetical protein